MVVTHPPHFSRPMVVGSNERVASVSHGFGRTQLPGRGVWVGTQRIPPARSPRRVQDYVVRWWALPWKPRPRPTREWWWQRSLQPTDRRFFPSAPTETWILISTMPKVALNGYWCSHKWRHLLHANMLYCATLVASGKPWNEHMPLANLIFRPGFPGGVVVLVLGTAVQRTEAMKIIQGGSFQSYVSAGVRSQNSCDSHDPIRFGRAYCCRCRRQPRISWKAVGSISRSW